MTNAEIFAGVTCKDNHTYSLRICDNIRQNATQNGFHVDVRNPVRGSLPPGMSGPRARLELN